MSKMQIVIAVIVRIIIGILALLAVALVAFGQVVRVDVQHPGSRSVGSGVVFSIQDGKALVATCSHGLDEGGTVSCHVPGTGSYPARIIHHQPKDTMEWSVLEFSAPQGLKAWPLATRQPVNGERVRIYGFPGAGPLYAYEGQINSTGKYSMTVGGVRVATANVPVAQGTSGGPVVSDGGEVIGIVWGSNSTESHITPSAAGLTAFPCPGGVCLSPQQIAPNQSPVQRPPINPGGSGWVSVEHWNDSIKTIDKNTRKHSAGIKANAEAIAQIKVEMVAIKGKPGPKGDQGPKGDKGDKGEPGGGGTVNPEIVATIVEGAIKDKGFWVEVREDNKTTSRAFVKIGGTLIIDRKLIEKR